jgi:hypothetical protein
MTLTALKRAEAAAVDRLALLRGRDVLRDDFPAYVRIPEHNLIPGVYKRDFWDDLESGDGNELSEKKGSPAKFCAAYSSSALAVNSFGPFRHSPELLLFAGCVSYVETQFERKCLNGLQGKPPNLDFFAASSTSVVGVESKFIEPLRRPKVGFPDQYAPAMKAKAEPVWRQVYESLVADPKRFKHLDAAQLVKHYLGFRNSLRTREGLKTLVYLYWEPTNADSIPEFVTHRREISTLASQVADSEVRFLPLTYLQLWRTWVAESSWDRVGAHVEALRQRYVFEI